MFYRKASEKKRKILGILRFVEQKWFIFVIRIKIVYL